MTHDPTQRAPLAVKPAPRPATAALLLALTTGVAGLNLVGCNAAGPRVAGPASVQLAEKPDGSLVLQLDADDFEAADGTALPRSMQRRWAGGDLTADHDTDPHVLAVRLAPPASLSKNQRQALIGDPPREAVLTFAPGQAIQQPSTAVPISLLTRPGATLTLVTPSSAPRDGTLRSGLARITFDADFLDAAVQLDPQARPADVLWLALRGVTAADLRRLQAARTPLSLTDAVRLADAGVQPAGLRQMERRGTIFRVDEWLALSAAGLSAADALALVDQGTPAEVDALIDVHQTAQRDALAAALEAQAAEQARLEAQAAAQAVAEAEAMAEQLEADALAHEAALAAQATTPSPTPTEPLDQARVEAHVQAPADAAPPDAQAAPPTDEAAVVSALPQPTDAPLLAEPNDDDDPAVTLAVNPTAADTANNPDPAADFRPQVAGDMLRTEPADADVPTRYTELLGKLGIVRPAHVAALYQARVPPKLIHRFQQAGVRPSVIELIDAHRLQLDPAAAQTLTDAGYAITVYDLALLDAAGVDPSYAAALYDPRFRPLTATQIVELWSQRVSVSDVRAARTKALSTPVTDRSK